MDRPPGILAGKEQDMNQYDREELQIENDLTEGRITQAEYNVQMRDLQQEYRAMARESAQDAYDREMERW